ncbi:hypothetical protein AB6A40_006217 [Gnathostoma spinigerum]|uniref:ABC transmembrane type-1 domain-containing protein n=1 Tax=Gnathostoma spinigerum TaxID=75299 RepID=A0ABD6EHR6_9BILA
MGSKKSETVEERISSSKKDASKKNGKKKKDKKIDAPKATLRQLFRYASTFEWFLILIGTTVSLATGAGFPILAIIIGDVSQSFIDAQRIYLISEGFAGPAPHNFTVDYDRFSSDVIHYCLLWVYVGIIIFLTASIQLDIYVDGRIPAYFPTHKPRREIPIAEL